MTPVAQQNQVTKQSGIYDTPVGMSGKIDTKTGLLVKAGQLGTQPYTVPNTPPPPIPITPTIAAPSGTTPGTDGSATIPPPAEGGATQSTEKSSYQKILDSIGVDINTLSGKGDAEAKLQEEQQLAAKTQKAAVSYNAYQKAQLDQAQTLERMKTTNESGTFGGAHEQNIAEYTARSNANLANLAIQAQADQGLEAAARKTIADKLDAQFKPIEDQIDRLTKFAQLNQNDLSESEKIALQAKITEKTAANKSVQDIANQLHQSVLDNGGDPAALAALDKVTQDYTAGRITAQEAQDRYFSAAGRSGISVDTQYKIAQIAKLNADTAALGTPTITNPEAGKYSAALSTILGSGKFTKDQKATVINSINNGEDPFTTVKNQAKNIMGQTEATKLTSYEAADSAMRDLAANLDAYYNAGGKTNLLSGTFEQVINKLGEVKDPAKVELATQVAISLQAYRNAISGTAYSNQEGQQIDRVFPGINKSEGLNKAVITGRLAADSSIIDGIYSTALGSKTYKDLKDANANANSAPPAVIPTEQIPAGYYQASDGLLYKKQ